MTQNLASVAIGISASVPLSIVFKATIVVAVGLLAVSMMRRARAARRFVVLASTFAALSALPIVVAFAPAMPVVVRESHQAVPSAPAPHVSADVAERTDLKSVSGAVSGPTPLDSARMGTLVALAWGIGIAISLVPMLMNIRRLRALRRTGRALDLGNLHNVGRAHVLVHQQLIAPITFGWIRPYILLPEDAKTWSDADVQRALVHEMEHVERRDWPVHLLARVVCAVYWFHPLVWVAWRQLHLEADRACDDAVAGRCNGYEFAEQLIALAGRIRPSAPAPALSMAGGDLVTRVNALLDQNQVRGRSGPGFAIAISLGAILLGAMISTLEAVEQTTLEALPAMTIPIANRAQSQPPRPVVKGEPVTPKAKRPVTIAPSAPRQNPPATQPQGSPTPAATPSPSDYVIAVGDVLTITYWGQNELTGEYLVRPDGKITVPLIQDVEAAGLTPSQLRDRLTTPSARLIADPQITVGVKVIANRNVFITGGVMRPGAYELVEPMSVTKLIALAGGLRQFVVGKGIVIIRTEDGKQISIPFDYSEVVSGRNLGQNIRLKPGDTVLVPE
jgi:polysaccharide export outer membrane protein